MLNSSSFFVLFPTIGGLLLDNNPWLCSCDLLWLSSWLRRWVRETRKFYALNFDVFLHQTQPPLQGHCIYEQPPATDYFGFGIKSSQDDGIVNTTNSNRNTIKIALIDLYPATVACDTSHIPMPNFHIIVYCFLCFVMFDIT